MPMGRELLDRDVEPLRWQIAHEFAVWTTHSAFRNPGSPMRKGEEIRAALDDVDFAHLFDDALGTIDESEFDDWHRKQVNGLREKYPVLNVGWAAKMIAVYLKTTCYLAGFGRDGLDSVIHPPFDNIMMQKMGEYDHNLLIDRSSQLNDIDPEIYDAVMSVSKEYLAVLSNARIKNIDDDFYWEVLIVTCERISVQLGCTLFEVEQLWTTE